MVQAMVRACGRRMRGLAVMLTLVSLGMAGTLRAQTSPEIAGTWQGTLQMSKEVRIVLKVSRDEKASSGLKVVLYPLDSNLGSQGRAATSISFQGAVLRFAAAPIDVNFEGRLSPDGAGLAGTWTQAGQAYPLAFLRATTDTAWEIPAANKFMAPDWDPEMEVATIKPSDPAKKNDGFHMRGSHMLVENETVSTLLQFSYGINSKQIVDAPGWFETDKFEIDGIPDAPGQPNLKQMQAMVRKILAERFKLAMHQEQRELSVYALTVAKTGSKLIPSMGDPNGMPDQNGNQHGNQRSDRFTNTSMKDFTFIMQHFVDRPVLDETGLTGRFDFLLKYSTDDADSGDPNPAPALFTAMQEQLGLKFEAKKAQANVFVVDHVEKPSSN